jgi:hypothetical protein
LETILQPMPVVTNTCSQPNIFIHHCSLSSHCIINNIVNNI